MRTPLTTEEHERLRMLLSWGYLGRHPADERLISLGLAEPHADDDASITVPRLEVVGPEGTEPYEGGGSPLRLLRRTDEARRPKGERDDQHARGTGSRALPAPAG